MLFSVANRSLGDVLSSESVSIELVRSAVGGIALALDGQQPMDDGLHALLDERCQIRTGLQDAGEVAQPANSRRSRSIGISGSTRTCLMGAMIVLVMSSRVRPTVRPKSSQFAAV